MNLDKLGKKLRREVAANPKKAVFLGLATLVAAYFWIPLVWGWIGKSDQAMATATVQTSATPTVTVAPAGEAAVKEAVPDRPSWPQIVQWMHNDPRTMTAPPLTKTRDPFESPKIEASEAKTAEQAQSKPPAITPAAAGLVLTSTIIGPQRRIAQISGKTYAVGQTIEAKLGQNEAAEAHLRQARALDPRYEVVKDKEVLGIAFKLVEVHPRRAVLEAEGQRFELMIPEPGKSGKIEFSGSR